MERANVNQARLAFSGVFQKVIRNYPANVSELNYTKRKLKLSQSKFAISYRGAALRNEFLNAT